MPPVTLAQMIQAAFRVVSERESLRLALLTGLVPNLIGYLGGVVGMQFIGLSPEQAVFAVLLGGLVGRLATLPATVRAGGDLLARRLDRPPTVEPSVAIGRAFRLYGLFLAAVSTTMALSVIAALSLGEGTISLLVQLALVVVTVYVILGFTMAPQAVFYEDEATVARSFAIIKGDRPRIAGFLLVITLPFFFAGMLVTALGGADPAEPVALVLSLVTGFVMALSTGPMLIGLTVFYFAKRGEAPPDLIDPAGPRT